ncbi:MAG TPA: NADPH-dependent FMN reductase [Anaeromyxobacteraceae bacterium]|nr:NADPH-dependent FMN reductase [Anaeromyxobacteraceae bacterium]
MTQLVAIPGSLRRGSWNAALARAAAEAAPAGSSVEVLSIRGVPLYDADEEAERGIPDAVARLKDHIAAADGVLLVTPEYNNSVPGVLKNAVDWLSRPPADVARVFADRPFALLGASPGRGGTILAQAAWLPVMRTLGVRLWTGGRLHVSAAGQAFDAQGHLADAGVRRQLQAFVEGFVRFIGR